MYLVRLPEALLSNSSSSPSLGDWLKDTKSVFFLMYIFYFLLVGLITFDWPFKFFSLLGITSSLYVRQRLGLGKKSEQVKVLKQESEGLCTWVIGWKCWSWESDSIYVSIYLSILYIYVSIIYLFLPMSLSLPTVFLSLSLSLLSLSHNQSLQLVEEVNLRKAFISDGSLHNH